jgi:pimeloyl-ACP methyl ester carboxylesterase
LGIARVSLIRVLQYDRIVKSGVGHFRDEAARARFRAAYERAFEGLPEPDETKDVPTSFGTVRAYRFGSGTATPLLLLPGRTASTPMWRDNLAGLAGPPVDRPVWTVDLLGEPGLSVQREPIRSAADQAAWLAAVVEGAVGGPVHLLGVSIGGWAAVNLAIRAPERVASVSLLDPASVFGRFTWKVVLVSLGSVIPVFPGSWRRALLSWISGGADASEDEPSRRSSRPGCATTRHGCRRRPTPATNSCPASTSPSWP